MLHKIGRYDSSTEQVTTTYGIGIHRGIYLTTRLVEFLPCFQDADYGVVLITLMHAGKLLT